MKKIAAVVLLALLCVSLLASCADGSGSATPTDSEVSQGSPEGTSAATTQGTTVPASVWPESGIAVDVPRPKSDYEVFGTDIDTDLVIITLIGMNRKTVGEYAELLQKEGFDKNVSSTDVEGTLSYIFSADNGILRVDLSTNDVENSYTNVVITKISE